MVVSRRPLLGMAAEVECTVQVGKELVSFPEAEIG